MGLDAASLKDLDTITARVKLPNFERIRKEGSAQELHSVYPYVTAPGWTSIFSGVNPGKHGIFDMYGIGKEGLKPSNMNKSGSPFLWDYLTWAGKKILVVGVPFYHPAPRINGVFVTGRFTQKLSFTPEATGDLADLSGFEYSRIEKIQDLRTADRQTVMEMMIGDLEKRKLASLKLMDSGAWDAVIFVDALPDELFHTDYENLKMIDSAYLHFDDWLGEILRRMRADDNLLVVSDHGFGGYQKIFYINEWLASKGFIQHKDSVQSKALRKAGIDSTLLNRDGVEAGFARFLVRHFPSVTKRIRRRAAEELVVAKSKRDTRSKVFSFGTNTPVAWLRLRKGHEDTMEPLMRELKELKASGIIKSIFLTSDLYSGKEVPNALGQILVESNDEYIIDARRMNNGKAVGERHPWEKGCHKVDGILMSYPNKITDSGRRASLYDIVPTTLSLLRIPIPPSIDGRALLGTGWELGVSQRL